MTAFCLFTFQSTHDALKAERCLKAVGIVVTVLPVPKEINSNCGIALGVPLQEWNRAEKRLGAGKVAPEGVREWKRK